MKRLLGFLMVSILVLAGCGQKEVALTDIVKGFKDAGLTADNAREMERDDFGMAPMKSDKAQIFEVGESNGETINGRLLQFKSEDDLDQTKKYYDTLGEESAVFYSHTYKSEDGKFLLQMNGDIDDATFKKYKDTMNKVIKGEKVNKVASTKKDSKSEKSKDVATTSENESAEESKVADTSASTSQATDNIKGARNENSSAASSSNVTQTEAPDSNNVALDGNNQLPSHGIGGHPSLYDPTIPPPSEDNWKIDEEGNEYYDATNE
ncbi:hypothetical protein MUA26_07605 [Staphylococcus sp. IVB6246]|uniref:LptM family lipoprotein n=1 Tax=Staphylococcus sp. IVB6246 TaxID=2989772 RepID=UPI0021D3C080|nr:hypothetical protein [Staphylococcus sp. IVB6246]UXR69007.1 hypothetical protein MUA26_07605 [Staphylococcus sp. IVB6246]